MKVSKTRYVIAYSGIFFSGYVVLTWKKPKKDEMIYKNSGDDIKSATKFYFKFIATFFCYMLNKSHSDYTKTFSVLKINT